MRTKLLAPCALLLATTLLACGGNEAEADSGGDAKASSGGGPPQSASGRGSGRGGGRPGGFGGFGGGDAGSSAIPVEVTLVESRSISDYLETNGSLEAENEVDIVSRMMGPIVEVKAEEGDFVREGQLLARIDDEEVRAQLEIARVSLEEKRLAYERAKASWEAEIISKEILDLAKSSFDTAAAQIRSNEIQLAYTEIKAPFSGLVIERAIKLAEHVPSGTRLFRLSDFTPLLCEIQLPEKDIGRLRKGQSAYLTVEAFPEERFRASVLRINPVVEAGTGTIRTTLEVRGEGRLRPGMFASVFLQVAVHENALIVPKEALVLESIGDTVFVVEGDAVIRREVEIGFAESDVVEIVNGVSVGEQVVVIGQDSLSDGTKVTVLGGASEGVPGRASGGRPGRDAGRGDREGAGEAEPPGRPTGGPPGGRGGFDPQNMTPEMEERMRSRMKERGLTDEQIDERLKSMREGNFQPGQGGPVGRRPGEAGGSAAGSAPEGSGR